MAGRLIPAMLCAGSLFLLTACASEPEPSTPPEIPSVSDHDLTATAAAGEHAAPVESPAPAPVQGGATVERFGIYEIEFPWSSAGYDNPWEQVQVAVSLEAPSGKAWSIGGFYYAPDTWRARFSPDESGDWTWTAALTDGAQTQEFSGAFEVVDSNRPGFVRPNPENSLRWVFDDGSPYYPIGIGDCILGLEGQSPLDNFGFDGENRNDEYPEGWRTDMETYSTAYGEAGFNLFRWSVDNCSFGLYETIDPAGNVYRQAEGLYGDQLVDSLRRHGLRTYMVIFGFFPPFPDGSGNQAQMDAIRRYVKYVVDRYAAYVDFWELMNESPNPPITIDDDYYIQVATYLREVDPYDHPISTSWQRPDLDVIDINSPHWYQKESEFESDLALIEQLGHAGDSTSKPTIFGEQGNSNGNWDEGSALRMRIRSWTAFFKEVVLIFWNTSCCKDSDSGFASNIYLGPQERGYIRVLQDFVAGLDRVLRTAQIEVSDPARVRGYALSASSVFVAYLHAYTDHTDPTTGISITVDSPLAGTATWIDPATGAEVGSASVSPGRQTLDVPAFITDIALRIAP
ncbi:MAG: DUF5060 domain-containing protein [Chloroflexi bacterium]|nr:DUF5060 domain-containing protein [Chloroflexota bacterium]